MESVLARWLDEGESGEVPARSDEMLLRRFLDRGGEGSQEAFRALVERHGPMVLGVCRHVLGRRHDAEDAFQATFLALARRGHSIRDPMVLAGWLHEVAYRIAIRVRAGSARRLDVERRRMAMLPPPIEPTRPDEGAAWAELRPVLHQEVDRLPEKYRLPVILSYLEGKTNEEVAEQLRWPVGTVKGRLSRARELLRSRLMRRGLVLSATLLVTCISRGQVFAEEVPARLVRRTVRLALREGSAAAPPGPDDPPGAAGPPGDDLLALADLPGPDLPRRRRRRRPGSRVVATMALAAIAAVFAVASAPSLPAGLGGITAKTRAVRASGSARLLLPMPAPGPAPNGEARAGLSASRGGTPSPCGAGANDTRSR